MIDLAYSASNYLLPDGTMKPASCSGTQGSMGTVPGYKHGLPHDDAVLIKFGPKYVHGQRDESPEHIAKLVKRVEDRYGVTVPAGSEPWSVYVNGDSVWTMARRLEIEDRKTELGE